MNKAVCTICPHKCSLKENETGFCRARINRNGTITALNYGIITSLALDPIEKKPLYRFYPGSMILSVGSFGCNFRCRFCQNHEISMAGINQAELHGNLYKLSTEKLTEIALSLRNRGNIGIAYTYNEPLVGYEFVHDSAAIARKNGLKNVIVTNGYILDEPLKDILPLIDAMNIDMKAFSDNFYNNVKGDLETVKKAVELTASHSDCHLEVTTLIIPGENDNEEEIEDLSKWLSSLNKDIPFHLTRFFPRYRMTDKGPTDIDKLKKLAVIAQKYLNYVYIGNC